MKAEAIVYTSNTGYTQQYAKMLGTRLNLPVYSMDEAKGGLSKDAQIIYLGWLMANHIKGYKKAEKKYTVCAVCGVGLCDTGELLDEVRKASALPDVMPLFTLQGGMDISKLHGINKFMIKLLTKMMDGKKDRTDDENRMLELLKNGGNFVNAENIEQVIAWYER